MLIAGALVVALLVIGGAGIAGVLVTRDDGAGGSAPEPEEPLGIDDPRTPEPVESPGGTGGEVGAKLLEGARSAGFTCGRTEGYLSSRTRCHHTETDGQVPTVQQLDYRVHDGEVVEVATNLESDPAWRGVPEEEPDEDESGFGQNPDYDVRGEAGELLTLIGSLTVPESEVGAVSNAVGEAMTDVNGEIDTDTFSGTVSLQTHGGSLTLRRVSDDEDVTATTGPGERGLWYVRGVDAEETLEQHGLSCDRGQETSTCTGDDVEATVTFPRPHGNADHTITEISVTAPAVGDDPPDELVAVAQAIAALAVNELDEPAKIRDWGSQECFDMSTQSRSVAGQTFTCTPEIEGSVASPKVVSYTFEIT